MESKRATIKLASDRRVRKPDDYKEVAAYWDTYYNGHSITYAEDRLLTSVVRRIYKPGMRVLDIGCGTGMVLENIDISPNDYVGVDISQSMMRVARKKFPKHTFRYDDAEALSTVESGSIDFGMFLFGVFPFTNPGYSLIQLRRVLKNGAPFAITFYNKMPMEGSDGYQAAFFDLNIEPPECEFYSVGEAKELFGTLLRLQVESVVPINSSLCFVERLIPKPMRFSVLKAYAFAESWVASRLKPDSSHHFVLVGKAV